MRRCEKGSLAGDPFVCIRCGLGMQIRHCFRALCGASERGGQGGAVLCGVLPQKSRLTRCHYSLIFMLCIPSSVEFFT